MPSLQLPPKRPQSETAEEPSAATPLPHSGRYGGLDHHDLIHLLDTLDDERARAQFRESVYISTIICLGIAWFLFYGPHIILHQPYYKDPIALMKQRDLERLTYINPQPAAPVTPPRIDRRTLQQMQKQAEQAKVTPQPPSPPPPEPQVNTGSVEMPKLPTPTVPKPNLPAPESALPAAPKPTVASNAAEALRNSMRGAMSAGGRPDLPSTPGGAAGPLQAGATILSDTQGVDFNAYMRRLRADLYRNWTPLIPEEVEPPILKKGIVGIRFSILPDGQIGDMKLETQSGDVALDKAAWYAITSEGQFPPLPHEYHGPQLDLRIGFFYNQPVQQRP
jgi:outer membrane biosynthesis protein TonB